MKINFKKCEEKNCTLVDRYALIKKLKIFFALITLST